MLALTTDEMGLRSGHSALRITAVDVLTAFGGKSPVNTEMYVGVRVRACVRMRM